ncbi:protein ROLLING AND ERECT LEAF 2-like [Vicia villosa]|uniref:protein ROLLING AND ERECT LEAF 2-like n=1 Tax=Vicia villosa TaxID=3911 RepID=UPI00273AE219|nr:protein ROLLING AND ERECT LEAF 2-like [Vicia villosa]
MGCVLSSFDEDERVRICKERKKVIKQLVCNREDFSDSLLAYLKALRNTGGTLRQFTESDTLELDFASTGLPDPPPSPPPNLLLPPPVPPFLVDKGMPGVGQDEMLENDDVDPIMNSMLLFRPMDKVEGVESLEEENWEETKTEFEDEVHDSEGDASARRLRNGKQQVREPVDDNNPSAICLFKKETHDAKKATPKGAGRNAKTLEGIVKELDDHFLKASACIKEIAVLIDISSGDTLLRQNSGRHISKRTNSARVFSVLSWSRHTKSPTFTKDDADFSSPSEPCRPGAHCATLKKLYAAEKKLYKAVKEEGVTKLEFERKSASLQKEDENLDSAKIEKIRSNVEKLESDLISLRQCISETSSSILELIDEELLPQLVALTAGLSQMWKIMHECHQSQTLISQQLSKLSDNHNTILSSEYHHQATIQFESEVSYWYTSFCKLVKSQREYVGTLSKWIKHTNCLREDHESGDHSSVRTICEQWEPGLDGLPDKEVADAIKNLLVSIRSIIAQQAEEDNILKKLEKLERKLQRCSASLAVIQKKMEWNFKEDDGNEANISPRHPLFQKKAETEALKKQVESVKADYLDSVQCSRTMTLDSLRTRLPHLFLSLMEFSSASSQAIEAINSQSSQ